MLHCTVLLKALSSFVSFFWVWSWRHSRVLCNLFFTQIRSYGLRPACPGCFCLFALYPSR